MRARRALGAGSLVIGLGALVLMCWRFGLAELVTALGHASRGYLLIYFCAACAVRFGYSWRWCVVARALGESLPLARFVPARMAGDALGALFPGRIGGDPLRAAFVYSRGVGGTHASAGVAIDRVMELIGNTLCAVAYVTVFSFAHRSGSAHRAAEILITTMLLLLLALVIPLIMLRYGHQPLAPLYWCAARAGLPRLRRWSTALRETESHLMLFFGAHPGTFIWGLLASLVIEGLIIVEYHFLLASFGLVLDLPTLLMVLVAGGLAQAVPTPGGVGALEASQVTLLAVVAGRPDVGFVVGMVLRLHETLWLALGLAALSLQGVSLARLRSLASAGSAAA